jgi:hypothetical protein
LLLLVIAVAAAAADALTPFAVSVSLLASLVNPFGQCIHVLGTTQPYMCAYAWLRID